MNRFLLFALVSPVIVVNSVESAFSANSIGRLFAKRSGVRIMASPLENLQVSMHQAVCAIMCVRRPGCRCCNLGPINNVTKNTACELLSGENISPVTGGAAADWTTFVGTIIFVTSLLTYICKPVLSFAMRTVQSVFC